MIFDFLQIEIFQKDGVPDRRVCPAYKPENQQDVVTDSSGPGYCRRVGGLLFDGRNCFGRKQSLLARKILRKGIPPDKLPVLNPYGFNFIINKNAAESLNLNIEFLKQFSDELY